MSEKQPIYIPQAIPYVNGLPHLGHALEFTYADVLARWYRSQGHDVWYTTGADTHGQKIADKAEERGMTPQAHVDDMVAGYKSFLERLDVRPDDFISTTEERHQQVAQLVWSTLQEKGDIYKGTYEGLYCVGCEEYKTEKDLNEVGECPNHLKKPQVLEEENYFFKLSQYGGADGALAKWYVAEPENVVPSHRRNEMLEIIKGGLEDVAISRETEKMSWGIPVPGDESQVMYVWFEAVLNYLTTLEYPEGDRMRFWPPHTQVIGKDINRFHSIMWPAILMGLDLPLPRQIAVHGFISVNGQKMSKSLGNVIDPDELLERYGSADPVRYLLLREVPYHGEGDLSMERLDSLYGAHLANGIGNLLSRVTNMCARYMDGNVDAISIEEAYGAAESEAYHTHMAALDFHKALEAVWKIVDDANEFIEQEKPWELAKAENTERLQEVLQHLVFALNWIGEHLAPFMPSTSNAILSAAGSTPIEKAQPLFPRLPEPKELEQSQA